MKTLKKFNLYLLMGFAMMAALSSCQKEAVLETPIEEVASTINEGVASKKPPSPTPKCYNAWILGDEYCNGGFELYFNEITTTPTLCWEAVANLEAQLEAGGICPWIPPSSQNCQQVKCIFN